MSAFVHVAADNTLSLPQYLTIEGLKEADFSASLRLPGKVSVCGRFVKCCDSVGIAALIWLLREATKQGSELTWVNMPEKVIKLLDLYELNNKELIANARTID